MATDSISRLIFNTLARHENLNLPGIGSLRIISEPARMRGNKTLAPPSTQVCFSPSENPEAPDILKLIGEKSGKTEQASLDNYQKWAEKVYEADVICIPSVGTVEDGHFTPTVELDRALNPAGTQSVKLRRQMSASQFLLWVAAALLAGGGLAASLIVFLDSRPSKYDAPYADVTPRGETSATTSGIQPQEATTQTDEDPAAIPAEPGSTVTVQPATAPKSGEPHYYVVVGTYSTDANAERFIASARRRDNTQHYRKLPFSNGKIMVYTADVNSEAEAHRLCRAITHHFPDAWIHKRPAR